MRLQFSIYRLHRYVLALLCYPRYIVILHLARTSGTGVIICIIGRNSSLVTIATFYLAGSLTRLVFTSVSIEAERYSPRFLQSARTSLHFQTMTREARHKTARE